ncbi:MAG: DUF2927 domain-containing protein [Proteobacteria bacterium]|nr:DUF2927 domain-containing protein [Pseudomonadota bacterium]
MTRFAAVAFLLILAASPATAQDRPATASTLQRNFEAMVFDATVEVLPWSPFRRWREEVRAVLIGEGSEAFAPHLRALFGEFEALTGIRFTLSESDSAATVEIVFARRDWYLGAAARSFTEPERVQCFSNTVMGGQGWMLSGFVVIPDDLPRREVEVCLAHEMMHILGFSGHPSRTFSSVLRNGNAPSALTINDRILLRAFYDPELRAGMLHEEMFAASQRILRTLRDAVMRSDDAMAVLTQRRRVNDWLPDAPPA